MASSSNEIMRQTLQERLKALLEDYKAANQQLGYSIDSVEKLRIKRNAKQIEAEINEVNQKLGQLSANSDIRIQEKFPGGPRASSSSMKTTYRTLVDEYHGKLLFNGRLKRELKAKGFEVRIVTEAYPRDVLFTSDIFVIWFPRYFDGKKAHFFDEEVSLIREYLEQGGSALLIGLGWAWAQYGERPSIETYPLNRLAENYGIFFSDAFISHVSGVSHDDQPITFEKPFMSDHPITQDVTLISASKAAPGSLVVSPPAIPLIWGSDQLCDSDGARNPIILAAAAAGQGKLVCMQHAAYINSLNDDNFTLLVNILKWLVGGTEGDN